MPKITFMINNVEQSSSWNKEIFTIGRSKDNDLQLSNNACSPYHCQIERVEKTKYKLVDRESLNGTKLNGKFVNQAILKDGDTIEVGGIELKFLLVAEDKKQNKNVIIQKAPSYSPVSTERKKYSTRITRRHSRSSSSSSTIIITAIGVGLFLFIILFFMSQSKVQEEERYQKYFTIAKNYLKTRNYKKAIKYFQKIPSRSSLYESAQQYIEDIEKKIEQEQEIEKKREKMKEAKRKLNQLLKDYRLEEFVREANEFLEEFSIFELEAKDVEVTLRRVKKALASSSSSNIKAPPPSPRVEPSYREEILSINELRRQINQLISQNRFGEAKEILDEFQERHIGTEKGDEALKLNNILNTKAEEFFEKEHRKAQEFLKNNQKEKARQIYRHILNNIGRAFVALYIRTRTELEKIK